MTNADFTIKQGVRLPSLSATLRDDSGEALDLDEEATVQFRLRRVGQTDDVFTRSVTVVDAATGKVRYDWQAGDTDEAGSYEGEFLVTTQGLLQSFPGDSFIGIEVAANATLDDDDLDTSLVFCTAAQARDIVRTDVPLDALALAQTVLSMHTGIDPMTADPEDAEAVSTYYDTLDDQDQLGLRQAVAFQAVWLGQQPDYLTRMSVTSESGDGESRNYGPNALTLAPMAQWALRSTRFNTGTDYSVDTPRDRAVLAVAMVSNSGWKPWRG